MLLNIRVIYEGQHVTYDMRVGDGRMTVKWLSEWCVLATLSENEGTNVNKGGRGDPRWLSSIVHHAPSSAFCGEISSFTCACISMSGRKDMIVLIAQIHLVLYDVRGWMQIVPFLLTFAMLT